MLGDGHIPVGRGPAARDQDEIVAVVERVDRDAVIPGRQTSQFIRAVCKRDRRGIPTGWTWPSADVDCDPGNPGLACIPQTVRRHAPRPGA